MKFSLFKKILLVLIFSLSISKLLSQEDTSKINSQLIKAKELFLYDYEKSNQYIDSAIQLINDNRNNQSDEIKKKYNSIYNRKLIDCYYYKARILRSLLQNSKAIYYLLNALKLAEKAGSQNTRSILIEIGTNYAIKGHYELGEKYNQKALQLLLSDYKSDSLNPALIQQIVRCYNNLGGISFYTKKFQEGINYYNEGIRYLKNNEQQQLFADAYISIGDCYKEINNIELAKSNYRKAISYSKDTINTKKRSIFNMAFAKFSLLNKDYSEAIYHLKTLESIVAKSHFSILYREIYKDYINVYHELNQPKEELYFQKKLAALNDSVYQKNIRDYQIELEQKYQSEQREQQIIKLTLDKQVKEITLAKTEKQQQIYLFGIIGLISILLFLVVLVAIINSKKNYEQQSKKLLEQKNKELIEKAELIKIQTGELAKQQSRMNPHFIFNALSSIQSLLVNNKISQSIEHIVLFSTLMRTTLNNSEKELISIQQEIDFLSNYIDFEQRRFVKKINYTFDIDTEIDIEDTLIIPMLIQPFIENSMKHAGLGLSNKNGTLEISLKLKQNTTLEIQIRDNGKGIKNANLNNEKSQAIKIARKRIEILNEKHNLVHQIYFEINDILTKYSNEQTGTEVIIKIPYITKH